jgi:RNA polymerase sigma factor (sigma-70 family)
MRKQRLHLIDVNGDPVSPPIRTAVEAAMNWVNHEFPQIDQAVMANAAELLAKKMESNKDSLGSPRRYAYVALRGKVIEWMRRKGEKELAVGLDSDLEKIAGVNHSFQHRVDGSILFQQLRATLSDRDREILVLLLSNATSTEIADHLGITPPAARKATQRLRERLAACLQVARSSEGASLGPNAKDLGKEWI